MTKPPAPSSTDQTLQGLAKLGLVLRHQAWQTGSSRELTPTQSQILATLASEPNGLGVVALASRLGISAASCSESVDTLVRRELVDKRPGVSDARARVLTLTPAGKRAAQASRVWPDALLCAVQSLDHDERAAFTRGLIKMISSLIDAGEIDSARMCPTCVNFRPHAHRGADKPHHCALVDAPLGDASLRLDCPEHQQLGARERPRIWKLFVKGKPLPS